MTSLSSEYLANVNTEEDLVAWVRNTATRWSWGWIGMPIRERSSSDKALREAAGAQGTRCHVCMHADSVVVLGTV